MIAQVSRALQASRACRAGRVAAYALVSLLAAACRSDPPTAAERLELDVPSSWAASAVSSAVSDDPWWNGFDDPGLSRAVEAALAANWDLEVARRRIAVAAAESSIVWGAQLPTVDAGGSAGRERSNIIGLPFGGDDVLETTATSYGVSLNVGWEVDLWGRLAARSAAAESEFRATVDEARGAAHSIAAQTAKAWLAWIGAREQTAVTRRTVASLTRTLELVRSRYQSGVSSAFDVRLAQSDLETARAVLSREQEVIERAVRQLEVLCGRHPDGLAAGFEPLSESEPELPPVPALPGAGLPSEILERRPDLDAAAARIEALDHELFAARAALYPSLTLSASAGRSSNETNDLLDPDFDIWSIAAGVTQPIFRGGQLRARVEAADARLQQALAGFAGAVLVAFGEVETLLAVEGFLVTTEELARTAAERARAALALSRDRYSAGLIDLPTVLETERRTFTTEGAAIEAHRRRLEARIDLHLALGGGFGELTVAARSGTGHDAALDSDSDSDPEAGAGAGAPDSARSDVESGERLR